MLIVGQRVRLKHGAFSPRRDGKTGTIVDHQPRQRNWPFVLEFDELTDGYGQRLRMHVSKSEVELT